jgi:hypothetical protein
MFIQGEKKIRHFPFWSRENIVTSFSTIGFWSYTTIFFKFCTLSDSMFVVKNGGHKDEAKLM